MSFRTWACHKTNVPARDASMKEIRDAFREELGLIVSVVLPNAGSSNDGNTARKFFRNFSDSARITGVNEELIFRFYIILEAINSNRALDATAFGLYCNQTAELYVRLYPWYHMPVTVHKLLIHGEAIVNNSLHPVGTLSEEAQEASNKLYKRFREFYSMKNARETTNRDVMNRLLANSDPYIHTLRREPPKENLELPEEVKALLQD